VSLVRSEEGSVLSRTQEHLGWVVFTALLGHMEREESYMSASKSSHGFVHDHCPQQLSSALARMLVGGPSNRQRNRTKDMRQGERRHALKSLSPNTNLADVKGFFLFFF